VRQSVRAAKKRDTKNNRKKGDIETSNLEMISENEEPNVCD